MKVTVYLKKSSPEASNICFRVRDKNVDIKVVSTLEVQDKYWDSDTLSYRRTTLSLPLSKNGCRNKSPPSSSGRRKLSRTRPTAGG